MSAARVSQVVKRIPLIKFRYGNLNHGLGWAIESPAAVVKPAHREIQKPVQKNPIKLNTELPTGLSPTQPVLSSYNAVATAPPKTDKEFYQLPKKYRRQPISDYEMSLINNGGPE